MRKNKGKASLATQNNDDKPTSSHLSSVTKIGVEASFPVLSHLAVCVMFICSWIQSVPFCVTAGQPWRSGHIFAGGKTVPCCSKAQRLNVAGSWYFLGDYLWYNQTQMWHLIDCTDENKHRTNQLSCNEILCFAFINRFLSCREIPEFALTVYT